jgi:mannosyl-oligosaccharide alpha-1,2-mannosidase
VNGCHDTYASEVTGIGPEIFAWVEADTPANSTLNPPPPADQAAFYEEAGFYNTDPFYDTRPEVIESYYYAFRATGDQMYRDWAWDAFVAINASCRATSGFSNINNVSAADGGGFGDFQESFLFAEVMKYSFLIQAPVSIADC